MTQATDCEDNFPPTPSETGMTQATDCDDKLPPTPYPPPSEAGMTQAIDCDDMLPPAPRPSETETGMTQATDCDDKLSINQLPAPRTGANPRATGGVALLGWSGLAAGVAGGGSLLVPKSLESSAVGTSVGG
jgi:hypothetical protein